jgi:guanylate kinase
MKPGLIIIAAPSGAGKSSFVERITKEIDVLFDTVTYTTRPMRLGESEGHPYHFVSRERFRELLDQGFFVESAEVHGNLYGTPLHQLEEAWAAGKVVIMDVDVQGAQTFRKKFPHSVGIFILPPSLEELKRRIVKRAGGRMPEDLDLRLENAHKELQHAQEFEHQIVNDEFESSYRQFKKIVEDLVRGH